MLSKVLICDLARPFLTRAPRGAIRLLTMVGGGRQDDPSWFDAPRRVRVFRDHDVRAYILVDLADWGGRWHYYAGRYYDLTNQLLIRQCIGPGDTYVDVGCNHGVHALMASKVVGAEGRVYAFEPDPRALTFLQTHILINRIQNCRVFPIPLADAAGGHMLNVSDGHTGTSTLRPLQTGNDHAVPVSALPGDEVLTTVPTPGKVMVKIDVEGFEYRVLTGLECFLKESAPLLTVEITPSWISVAGGSVQQLFAFMHDLNYLPFVPHIRWCFGFRSRLRLRPYDGAAVGGRGQFDILFVPTGQLRHWNLEPCLS